MKLRHAFLNPLISLLLVISLLGASVSPVRAMTTEEEKKMGKSVLNEMLRKLDVVRDLSLQTFINRVGRSLAKQVAPTPYEFDFYVIKANDPNAFAVPGGHIFITTGLIALAENESELAGVISHEISHITGRHVSQMIERSKRLTFVTLAAMIAGALVGKGGKASEASTAMSMATAEAMMLKYTRDNEVDADQNSLHVMVKAGYNPESLIDFLIKMERYSMAMAPKIPQYLSTHPALENRVALLENLVSLGPKPEDPFRGIGSYKRIQNRAFVEERDPSGAVDHFEARLKAHPEDPDALLGLGLAYQKAGRLDKSIEVLTLASRNEPKDLELVRELGIAYFLSGRLDAAFENLTLASQDNAPHSLYYFGRAAQEKGEMAQALAAFQRVQKEVPDYPEIYFNLGSVYGRMGKKGLSHFSFGKHFDLKGDRAKALLHYRTSLEFLEKGSPEGVEAQRIVKELAPPKK